MKTIVIHLLMIGFGLFSTLWPQTKPNSSGNPTLSSADQLTRYVIGGGGAVAASNGSSILSFTVGQSAIAVLPGSQYQLSSGFWVPVDISGVVEVTSPTAGDNWEVGSTQQLQWVFTSANPVVKIELSRNNGATWETLFTGINNDGVEPWGVSMPRSGNCRIRINGVPSGLFSILPQSIQSLTKLTPQPGGTAQGAYRLISVPVALNSPGVGDVLIDDLGPYDPKKWRFFDYQSGSYNEYDNTRTFAPGRSFFLITKNGATVDAGSGTLVADSVITIALSPGWNFIANPYNFEVNVSRLSIVENQPFQLRTFNGDWTANGSVTVLNPWEGYILKVNDQNTYTLRIAPFSTGIPGAPKIARGGGDGWAIQIKAQCQEARDQANYAGVRSGAAREWDPYDAYEPPSIGDYVMLYFPHREWSDHPDIYAEDIRPANEEGYSWEFEVRSNIEDEVILTFERLEEAPAELEVWLMDQTSKQTRNLREDSQYRFKNLKKEQVHGMTLLAGDQEFVQEKLLAANAIPADYTLFDNFPNPFNPATAIRFALPEPQKVTLTVYNLLGQEVVKLLDGELRDSGYHLAYWDGRNKQGQAAASGIYIYLIRAGKFSKAKKMLLVK